MPVAIHRVPVVVGSSRIKRRYATKEGPAVHSRLLSQIIQKIVYRKNTYVSWETKVHPDHYFPSVTWSVVKLPFLSRFLVATHPTRTLFVKIFRVHGFTFSTHYDRNNNKGNVILSSNQQATTATLTMGEAVDCFAQSTQAKHWIFDDEDALFECRRQACEEQEQQPSLLTTTTTTTETLWNKPSHKRARKFASGYNNKQKTTKDNNDNGDTKATATPSSSNPHLEETLVQFHAHQLQRLIGPNAMLPELRRGATVLSTAMMLFRRFYLSNSVVDFHPRNMAAAAALLAVKADCEPNLPVSSILTLSRLLYLLLQRCPPHPPGIHGWPWRTPFQYSTTIYFSLISCGWDRLKL